LVPGNSVHAAKFQQPEIAYNSASKIHASLEICQYDQAFLIAFTFGLLPNGNRVYGQRLSRALFSDSALTHYFLGL